jgi:hypothetical protein
MTLRSYLVVFLCGVIRPSKTRINDFLRYHSWYMCPPLCSIAALKCMYAFPIHSAHCSCDLSCFSRATIPAFHSWHRMALGAATSTAFSLPDICLSTALPFQQVNYSPGQILSSHASSQNILRSFNTHKHLHHVCTTAKAQTSTRADRRSRPPRWPCKGVASDFFARLAGLDRVS